MLAQSSCGRTLAEVSKFKSVRYSSSSLVLFLILFFINEDRNTVSSPPLQTSLIEEVAYVKKIIVPEEATYHEACPFLLFVRSYCLFVRSLLFVLIVCLDAYKILSLMKYILHEWGVQENRSDEWFYRSDIFDIVYYTLNFWQQLVHSNSIFHKDGIFFSFT